MQIFQVHRPVAWLAAATILLAAGCKPGHAEGNAASAPPAGKVREPAVAGGFYPGQPAALGAMVETLLDAARKETPRTGLVAAVVPHAGYVYSGRCAASVYANIHSGRFDRVVIMGPSHYAGFTGIALPDPDLAFYKTPLGLVPIDRPACLALARDPHFKALPGVDAREHSVEVQLPFLQETAGAFSLVPLVCGRVDPAGLTDIGRTLAKIVTDRTLVLASSDFTHYGPNYDFVPFTENVRAELTAWLTEASDEVAALNLEGFLRHCREKSDTICGQIPIAILLATLRQKGGLQGAVLNRYLSGDVVGNYDNSVSYAAIGFFAAPGGQPSASAAGTTLKTGETNMEETVKEHRSGNWSPELTPAEAKTLFAIARDTLAWCVKGGRETFAFDKYTVTDKMKQDTATFVTLKINGELRGCIGTLEPIEPMYLSVHHNAINAALRDPRFMPVQPAELSRITIDVSILSPTRDIASPADFKIGRDGIIMAKGLHRAVYLPEVAPEQSWTVEETLSSLSMKAGLRADAWKEGARFKVFESVVLSE